MADSKDDDRDEEWFKEVYGKEYTGPVRPSSEIPYDNPNMKKRSIADASAGERDEDDAPPDPNAVPTDFTSREAKVWEAKAKAIERNWKKKKEEELICRICGEYGHFSQGCPTTLGVNRRQNEFVEKIPVKDKRLKPRIIGTSGSTIQGIEKETGCRLKVEDNLSSGNGSFFVRISGNSRVMVGKAVDSVKKLLDHVQDDRKPPNSRRPNSNSHNRGHTASPMGSSQMQRMQNDPNFPPYPGQEGSYYDDGRHNNLEQMRQLDARRQWESGGQNGGFQMGSYGHKGGSQFDDRSNQKGDAREEDRGPEAESGYDQPPSVQSIQALEHSFVQETMQLTKELNDAEDMENARHREAIRDIQEQYQQKMASLRAAQAKRREEFLRQEAQFRQQQYQQYQHQQPPSGPKYYNYDVAGQSMAGGFNNGGRDQQIGYNAGSSDRADALGGGYGFRGEGGYYNPQPSYRSAGYESGTVHMGNQGYDAGPYRY